MKASRIRELREYLLSCKQFTESIGILAIWYLSLALINREINPANWHEVVQVLGVIGIAMIFAGLYHRIKNHY